MKMHIGYNVSIRNIDRLMCLEAGCAVVLGFEEIERFAE
jgi:hypothetical protein